MRPRGVWWELTSTVSGYLTSFLEEGLIGILLNSLGQRVYTGLLRPLVYFSCGYGANMSIFMDILSKSCPAIVVFSRSATDRGGPRDPCLSFLVRTFTYGFRSRSVIRVLLDIFWWAFPHGIMLSCWHVCWQLFPYLDALETVLLLWCIHVGVTSP